jgi:hypothetical protein
MNENDLKVMFKRSIRAHGGFVESINSTMMSGLPDLFAVLPHGPSIVIEVKWMGGLDSTKFRRVIKYSPLQRIFLTGAHKAHKTSAFGLVGFRCNKTSLIYACLVHPHQTHIDFNFRTYCAVGQVKNMKGNFDIPWMQANMQYIKHDELSIKTVEQELASDAATV